MASRVSHVTSQILTLYGELLKAENLDFKNHIFERWLLRAPKIFWRGKLLYLISKASPSQWYEFCINSKHFWFFGWLLLHRRGWIIPLKNTLYPDSFKFQLQLWNRGCTINIQYCSLWATYMYINTDIHNYWQKLWRPSGHFVSVSIIIAYELHFMSDLAHPYMVLKPHCTTYSYLCPLYSKQCLIGDRWSPMVPFVLR